jgi:pyruvate dehydrogenase E1 component beta subunit
LVINNNNYTGDAFDYLDAPVRRITGADIPMPYAKNLEALSLPTPELIADVAKKMLS